MTDPHLSNDPLTPRDVLHAIFMPPEEAQEMRALEGINLDALRRRMQRAPDDDYGLDLKMLDPAAVDYSLPDILSSPLSRRDALILGGGTVATTLIAVLAQSALKGSTAGSSAFLVACLAWVLWSVMLLFVYPTKLC